IQLEETVLLRTGELKASNERLERELAERRVIEAQLKEHDALLHAVAESAEEILGARSLVDATDTVLALIGQTIGVSRIHVDRITAGGDGRLRWSVRQGWCTPHMAPVANHAALRDRDLARALPHVVGPLLGGRLTSFSVDEVGLELQALFEQFGMRSCLQIPIVVGGKLWGSVTFSDASPSRRQWNWAETDALQTLAGLFGVAIARERYIRQLADANMIVQNSPTI